MVKIKRLTCKNFCGYRYVNLDFTDVDDINNISVFYGPNGEGKSTALQAIQILANPFEYTSRDQKVAFRKLTYHPDYDPTYQALYEDEKLKNKNHMQIEGVFEYRENKLSDPEERQIVISSDGMVVNELPLNRKGYAYFIDADHMNNMNKFQIPEEGAEKFLEIAEIVYGYECELAFPTEVEDPKTKEIMVFYTDFMINKTRNNEITKVHFKRMSAGEKKIATLLRYLCTPNYTAGYDILLVDNIEMHVYFQRHAKMIDKIVQCFPDKQFIATTHSGTLIEHVGKKYGKASLYDLEEITRNPKASQTSGSNFFL